MPSSEIEADRPRALVIASDQYEDPGLVALRSPSRGAEELARALADEAIGGFDVQVLLNASAHVLLETIEDFFLDRRPEEMLLLYISCHGILDPAGQLHFAASTTKVNRLASTGISARFVQEQVEQCRARKALLLLDCCYSGAYARGHRPRPEGRAEIDMFEGSGRVVITSSTALEYAFESYSGQATGTPAASVLTAALVEGLRSGDADRDGDGLVSVNELYSYLYERVREATPHQSPEMLGHIRGDFIVARNPRISTQRLQISPSDLATSIPLGEELLSPSELTANLVPDDDPESFLDYWTRVVESLREGSDKLSLASALNKVGAARLMLQSPEDAVSPFEESAAICRDLGDRVGEMTALTDLIMVYDDLGYTEDSTVAGRRVTELHGRG